MKNQIFQTVIAVIFICLLSNSISAQTFLFQGQPKDKAQFGLRYMRPNFEGDDEMTTLSGIYDFFINIPVSSTLNIVSSLPYSTYADDDISESDIGNLYIGLQSRSNFNRNKGLIWSFGAYLPTASEDEYLVYFTSAFTNYHQFQKYIPNFLILDINFARFASQSSGTFWGIEIGPNLWIPTKDGDEENETELSIHYGISGGFQLSNLAIFAELVGIVIISEDYDEFSDRFYHTLGFGAQWTTGMVKPGIFYNIYLKEDLRDYVDGVLGIKIDIALQ